VGSPQVGGSERCLAWTAPRSEKHDQARMMAKKLAQPVGSVASPVEDGNLYRDRGAYQVETARLAFSDADAPSLDTSRASASRVVHRRAKKARMQVHRMPLARVPPHHQSRPAEASPCQHERFGAPPWS
jgi:hypothetical protein